MTRRYLATAVSLAAAVSLAGCSQVEEAKERMSTSWGQQEQARQRSTYTQTMNAAQAAARSFKILTAEQMAVRIDASGVVKPPVDVVIRSGYGQSSVAIALQRQSVADCLAAGVAAQDPDTITYIACIDQSNRPLLRATANAGLVRLGH